MGLSIIMGLIQVLAPLIYQDAKKKVLELIDGGHDPEHYDWVQWARLYGKSPQQLRHEVDTAPEGLPC